MTPFTVHVTLRIRPEGREEYRAALDKIIDHARALPECRYLYVFESAENRDTIHLIESWSDWDTFEKEILQLDIYRDYAAATEPLYAAPRDFTFMRPLHGSEWR